MARHEQYMHQQVIMAIRATHGMLTLAAERLGCDPSTIHRYATRHASVRQAIAAQRERMTDLAELKLYQAITNGEPWAIRYYLSCQARSRGYAERFHIRLDIQQVAARVGAEFGMTAAEIIAEAEAYLREEDD